MTYDPYISSYFLYVKLSMLFELRPLYCNITEKNTTLLFFIFCDENYEEVHGAFNYLKLKTPAGIAVAYQNEPMKGGERRK